MHTNCLQFFLCEKFYLIGEDKFFFSETIKISNFVGDFCKLEKAPKLYLFYKFCSWETQPTLCKCFVDDSLCLVFCGNIQTWHYATKNYFNLVLGIDHG